MQVGKGKGGGLPRPGPLAVEAIVEPRRAIAIPGLGSSIQRVGARAIGATANTSSGNRTAPAIRRVTSKSAWCSVFEIA